MLNQRFIEFRLSCSVDICEGALAETDWLHLVYDSNLYCHQITENECSDDAGGNNNSTACSLHI